MAWELSQDQWDPKVPSEYGGLLVVAAGNDGASTPVVKTKMEVAERSYHPGDMLAVMNVDDKGTLACDFSIVDPDGDAFAVAFRGDLSNSACGTSFSAPRLAWLLALRESSRPRLPDMTNLSIKTRAEFKAGGFSAATSQGIQPLAINPLTIEVLIKPQPQKCPRRLNVG